MKILKTMSNTAIIYSFNTRKSKHVAEKIIELIGSDKITAVNAEEISKADFEKFDNFIISAPTWFDGELPNYWDEFLPDLEELDLKGKKIAIFGLGDQKNYPENFCDAIGLMAELFENQGATIVANQVPVKGYTFESSKALRGEYFVGLPLDQDNQPRLTNERLKNWIEEVKTAFNLK